MAMRRLARGQTHLTPGRRRFHVGAPPEAAPAPAAEPDPLDRARELLAEGRVEEAREVYSHVLSQDPRNMKAREGIAACATASGHAALRDGDIARAVSHYQKALEIVPFHPGADDGLRRAAALAKEQAPRGDPLLAAIDRLPPVQAFREAKVAERVIARATGLPQPSAVVRERLNARHRAFAEAGAPPREERVERERESAWRRRWLFRLLPVAALAAGGALVAATGSVALLTWGALFALFALAWDLAFVERRRVR